MFKKIIKSLLGLSLALILLLTGLLIWPLPDMPMHGLKGNFVVRGVSVVDVKSGSVLEDQNVLVVAGKIKALTSGSLFEGAGSVHEIEGSGKFLVPGLWDMHTHSLNISPQYTHPLMLANGITGVREMWGCMSEPDSFIACKGKLEQWDRSRQEGKSLSPRHIITSSFQVNGGSEVPESIPDFFKVRDQHEAEKLVEFYRGAGIDSIKTYSDLSMESYQLLASETRKQNMMLAGHRPVRVPLTALLEAGHRSVEHPRLFLFECYRGAAGYRDGDDPLGAYNTEFRASLVDQHDRDRCIDLMAKMSDSETWWTPTLQVLRMSAFASDAQFVEDPRLKYIPYVIRQGMWKGDIKRSATLAFDPSGRNVDMEMYELALQNVRQAYLAGVNLLAGTDAGDTYVFPGFSIHDELSELVRAGLAPAEALRIATIDAAVFSGRQKEFGSVEAGKVADMILLNANPLLDITHTQEIEALFFSGQYLDRAALNELLVFAEQQAGSIRTNLAILKGALSSPLIRVQLAD